MAVSFANVTDITIPEGSVTALSINGQQVWEKPSGANELCFTALQANSSVKMMKLDNSAPSVSVEYSTDRITWLPYNVTTTGTKITLPNVGDKVYFRGENTRFATGIGAYIKFAFTGKVAASGDVTSLLNKVGGDVALLSWCFTNLFSGCSQLVSAPSLPSTSVADYSYKQMFKDCANLIKVPKLPTNVLAKDAYCAMFYGCTALYVSDTQTEDAPYAWHIPESGDATGTTTQANMFMNCLGTRATDSPDFATQKTFYTQNPPV